MRVAAQFCSKTRRGDEMAYHKLVLHSELMVLLGLDPWVQIERISHLSIHLRIQTLHFWYPR